MIFYLNVNIFCYFIHDDKLFELHVITIEQNKIFMSHTNITNNVF